MGLQCACMQKPPSAESPKAADETEINKAAASDAPALPVIRGSQTPGRCDAWTPAGNETPDHAGPIAGGLNQIITHLWPRISKYVTRLITTDVQDTLANSLPKILQGLRFDGGKCHLGTKPFEFRRIIIDKVTQVSANGEMQNLVFQAYFTWDADCSVFMSFSQTGIGIDGLSLHGHMIIELVGLIDRPPFFEGVRIFCNNAPELDIEFAGAAQELLNLSLVRSIITGAVSACLMDLMVVPNRLGYVCDAATDIFRIKAPPAQGLLTLTVVRASDIVAMDTSWFAKPSSDPYVTVHCGAYTFKSPTVKKSLNPTFNFMVTVPICEVDYQRLRITLQDEDLLTADDFLGRLEVPVKELAKWTAGEQKEVRLQDEEGVKGKSGTIVISTIWRPLKLEHAGANARGMGMFGVGVHSASQVPRFGVGSQFWCEVRCTGTPLPGFDFKKAQETAKLEELEDTAASGEMPSPTGSVTADEVSLMEKLQVLEKYKMSAEDVAKIIGKRKTLVSKAMREAPSQQAHSLLAAEGSQDFQWEQGFDFPLEVLGEAELSVTLKCKSKAAGGHVRDLGTYACRASEILQQENCTEWRTVALPGSGIILKAKFGCRYV